MYFSNLILFHWILVSHSFELWLCLIVIALTKHFKGHIKISVSTLYHKSHYPESHYQYSISNGIDIAKSSFFSYKHFFENIEHYIRCISIFFLLLSYSASISLWYNSHFSTISYPSIQRHPLVLVKNECLNFRKDPSISISEKIATRNIFGYFPVKHPCWSPFQVHLGASQKAVQSSCSVENLYAPASLKMNSTPQVISGIFWNFKNSQG